MIACHHFVFWNIPVQFGSDSKDGMTIGAGAGQQYFGLHAPGFGNKFGDMSGLRQNPKVSVFGFSSFWLRRCPPSFPNRSFGFGFSSTSTFPA